MKNKSAALYMLALVTLLACDKKNNNLHTPLQAHEFPQVILLDDEGDGGLEDEDHFSVVMTLAKKPDPSGKSLDGTIIPLDQDVTVQFEVTGFEGFLQLSDYIKDAEAFYEIDDCTTSQDQGKDLNLQFDIATGKGSVTFPAGVEEIEVEFETDEDLFDDAVFNTEERGVTLQLTGISNNPSMVTVNKSLAFTYTVQDDEGIYGEWQMDISNAAGFSKFRQLFGLINEDIAGLDAADVEDIILEFKFEEVKVIVALKETEQVDDCGSVETAHKIIEIEAEIEDLTDDELEGDVEFGETLERNNGSFAGFVYAGTFKITGNKLSITLTGEMDDDETDKITIELEK